MELAERNNILEPEESLEDYWHKQALIGDDMYWDLKKRKDALHRNLLNKILVREQIIFAIVLLFIMGTLALFSISGIEFFEDGSFNGCINLMKCGG